eukprot:2699903-Rhodomonas_salina.1
MSLSFPPPPLIPFPSSFSRPPSPHLTPASTSLPPFSPPSSSMLWGRGGRRRKGRREEGGGKALGRGRRKGGGGGRKKGRDVAEEDAERGRK